MELARLDIAFTRYGQRSSTPDAGLVGTDPLMNTKECSGSKTDKILATPGQLIICTNPITDSKLRRNHTQLSFEDLVA
jgi:hypothetical protein